MRGVHRSIVAVRRLLARRPLLYWLAVAAIGTLAVVSIVRRTTAADDARAAWEAETAVWVAAVPIEPGDRIDAVVERRQLPAALVPELAIDDPTGVARQHIDPGSVVTESDLGVGDGPLALVPTGSSAVAVVEPTPSGAAVGEAVSVASDGVIVVADALVVGRVDPAVLVAVPTDAAAAVAMASDTGNLAIIRHP